MDDSERRSAGMKTRRRVLGDAHVDRATARASAVTAEFQDLITRYAWGEIWTRPGLDERSRRILVLGTLIALGRFDEFRMHARAAIDHGGFTGRRLEGDRAPAGNLLRCTGGKQCVRYSEGSLRWLSRLTVKRLRRSMRRSEEAKTRRQINFFFESSDLRFFALAVSPCTNSTSKPSARARIPTR